MTIYSAYLPPVGTSALGPEDTFRLIPDAKAPFALIFTPFWLCWHKLWLELLAYLTFFVGVSLLALWQPSFIISYLSVLPGLYLLLEGNEHVRSKLERTGWRFTGVLDADTREEAELKFISDRLPKQGVDARPEKTSIGRSFAPVRPTHGTVGLFPE